MVVNFYIESYVKKEGTSQIRAQATYKGVRVRVDTGVDIAAKDWDSDKQQVRRSNKYYVQLNEVLRNTKQRMMDTYMRFLERGVLNPSKDEFLMSYLSYSNAGAKSVDELFEDFLEEKKLEVLHSRIIHYRIAYNHLREFTVFSLSDVSHILYLKFSAHLAAKGLLNNAIGSIIKQLKVFFSWCEKRGHHINPEHRLWKKTQEKINIITLTNEELALIENVDLSSDPHLENTRILFLLECYTGLRYSDASRISSANIRQGAIHITVQKTREQLVIPISAQAKKVLEHIY